MKNFNVIKTRPDGVLFDVYSVYAKSEGEALQITSNLKGITGDYAVRMNRQFNRADVVYVNDL